MKRVLKAAIALALALLMTLSLFACNFGSNGDGENGSENGSGNGNGAQNPQKSKPTNVYKETPLAISEEIGYFYSATYYNGRLYFPHNVYNEEKMANESSIVSMSVDGGTDIQTHYTVDTYITQEEGVYSYTYVENLTIDNEGYLWVYGSSSYEDYRDELNPIYESSYYIKKIDAAGNELLSIDLKAMLPDREYIYINRIKAGNDGALYISCGDLLAVVDAATGELIFTVSDNSYYESIINLSDGTVAVYTYDYNDGKQVLSRIDKAAKALGTTIELKSNISLYTTMEGDGEYLFYFLDYNIGIMGMRADGTPVEIVNFLNSDIDNSSINSIYKLDNGEFLANGYDNMSGKPSLSRLTKVPDSEVKEAVMIKFACMYLDYEIKRKILEFNKTNGEYRIVVTDYSIYNTSDDYQAGFTKLNADIIGGNIPDFMSLNGLNMTNFVNKGILADLYELMDASTVADRSDYVQSVLKADELGGKLYRFTPSYAIYTVAGKESLVGSESSWTFDDLNALLRSMPDAEPFMYTTKNDILYYMTLMTMDDYIDWDTGVCSFDENFAKLLEFANTFPESYDWDKIYSDENYDWTYYERAYKENLVLLQMSYVSSYRVVRDYENTFGEEVNFIGFPTSSGNGSVFYAYMQYGISERSPYKQVCFDFLAGTVQTEPDFTNSGGYFYGSFSLSQNYMDKVRAYELTPLMEREGYQLSENGDKPIVYERAISVMPVPDPGYNGNDYEANYHLTEEEVAVIDRLFTSTSGFYSENTAITNIINEEAAEFFAGRKTAMQATQLIQSRVQILVSEGM